MRALLVCCVVLSTAWAGCHEPEPNGGGDGDPSPGNGADAVSSEWRGDTESGIRCRLVQPGGPLAVGDEAPVRVEYVLANPDRFAAVEAEHGDGLARVAGALREADPAANETIEVTLRPLEEGEYIVQAYVVWSNELGGEAESCGVFDVVLATG